MRFLRPAARRLIFTVVLLFAARFALAESAATQKPTKPVPAAISGPGPTQPAQPAQPAAQAPTVDSTLPALAPLAALPALPANTEPIKRPLPAQVVLLDQTVFPITAAIGPFSPQQRAQATSRKLLQLRKDPNFDPASITTAESESGTDVLAGDTVLTTVTDADADFDALGRSRQKLAAAHVGDIRNAVLHAQEAYSAASLTVGALKSAAAAAVLVLILVLLHFIFRAVYRGIETRRGTHIRTIRFHSLELLTEARITEILITSARVLRFALTLLILYFFIPLLFSFFAPTRRFGRQLVEYTIGPVRRGFDAFLAYLPSLLVVVVVVFFTWQALKLTRFLFAEIERGSIHWSTLR